MSNSILGEVTKQEIRAALTGFQRQSTEARSRARRRAPSDQRLARLRHNARLAPAQAARRQGRRRADLLAHDGLRHAAELVTIHKLDPDIALETVALNGGESPVSQSTFNRYLRSAA